MAVRTSTVPPRGVASTALRTRWARATFSRCLLKRPNSGSEQSSSTRVMFLAFSSGSRRSRVLRTMAFRSSWAKNEVFLWARVSKRSTICSMRRASSAMAVAQARLGSSSSVFRKRRWLKPPMTCRGLRMP